MTNHAIRQKLRHQLAAMSGIDERVDDELDLIDSGAVASMDLLVLITFVADTFAIPVGPADVYDGRFASIAAIADLVEERRA